jgi:hypothetical protein
LPAKESNPADYLEIHLVHKEDIVGAGAVKINLSTRD